MPRFVLVYHGGAQPMSAEEADANKRRFMAWMGEVGTSLLSPANPFGPSKLVTSDGVTDVPATEALSGYSVVEAADLDAAVQVAQSCPFLEIGTLEVARLMEMPDSE